MITWNNFDWFALLSIALWGSGAVFALFSKERNRWAILLTLMGTLIFAVFIAGFWIYLQRPPLRTMGETRLWYSFFMGISGLLTYIRWKYPWILSFSTVVGAVFALINILKPEIHDQSLMPALQSPWFIPHVTIYMFSYSVLGCAFILSCMGLFKHRSNYLEAADKLIYTGLAFLTVGMLTGAIWAKAAWGHYWSWDPKETWALIVWLNYAAWLHVRLVKGWRGAVLAWWAVIGLFVTSFAFIGVNMFLTGLHSYGTL